jgi:lipoic acid synthetase
MVLGKVCTRNCLFCGVKSSRVGQPIDEKEPKNIAKAVKEMNLKYAVLTAVDRDDLKDFGAGHFAKCIKEIKKENFGVRVEALIPDYQGKISYLRKIVKAKPVVIGHNLETVERLQEIARDSRASYKQSLELIHNVKMLDSGIFTKSSLMLGVGEEKQEVEQAMDDLRKADCDFLTLGQYLQPTKKNLPVKKFVLPEKFEEFRKIGLKKGFKYVASGPLVRSSFRAGDFFEGNWKL